MICNKCNHDLPDDSIFCQYCGNKVEKVEAVEDNTITDNSAELSEELNDFDMTSDDALSAILKFQAKATIDAMQANADSQPNYESDKDFGLVPEKPIFTLATKSVDGEIEYLERLITESGEKITYSRRGSISAEGVNGMIDIYDTFLPSGELYKTIYINMYGAKASASAPKGFTFTVSVLFDQHDQALYDSHRSSTQVDDSKKLSNLHKSKSKRAHTKVAQTVKQNNKILVLFASATIAFLICSIILNAVIIHKSFSKKEEITTITLTSENVKQYLQMEVTYSNLEVEKVNSITGGLVEYHYVCTATYTIKSRGPYMFKDTVVYLKIYANSTLDGNPWTTALSHNLTALEKLTDLRRKEKIYLDSSGNGSVTVVWKYVSQLTTSPPNIIKPENQTWNTQFSASGTLQEMKWADD